MVSINLHITSSILLLIFSCKLKIPILFLVAMIMGKIGYTMLCYMDIYKLCI